MKRHLVPLLAVVLAVLLALFLSGCDVAIDEPGSPPPARCPSGKCADACDRVYFPRALDAMPRGVDEVEASPAGMLPVDLPAQLRQSNYGGGSCVHAAMVSVLRWQRLYDVADWWRESYGGGESLSGLVSKADRNGLRFAYTGSGDAEFLEWCSRTRRGAVIFYYPMHSISFFGYQDGAAVLMDNNRTARLIRVPKAQFIQSWQGYGGVALTAVYQPNIPRPWVPKP